MRAAIVAIAMLAGAGPALAAAAIQAGEAKATFFGLDMGGVYKPDGAPWRECITPAGETTYWMDGAVDKGRLSVRDDGALCFSYASSQYQRQSCYWAVREGQGWRFTNVHDPEVVFLAQRAQRVKTCAGNDAVS
ncbi:MAG: hypothetical protein AB7M12_06660 [Hyphomonadaceae bacterium]